MLIIPLQFQLLAPVCMFLWSHILSLLEWKNTRCTHWSCWLYFVTEFSLLQMTVRLIFVVCFEPLNFFFLFVDLERTSFKYENTSGSVSLFDWIRMSVPSVFLFSVRQILFSPLSLSLSWACHSNQSGSALRGGCGLMCFAAWSMSLIGERLLCESVRVCVCVWLIGRGVIVSMDSDGLLLWFC